MSASLSLREQIDSTTERLCSMNCDAESSCLCAAHQFRADVLSRLPVEGEIEKALSDAGIIDEHGTLRWVFRPGQIEVSSSGGTERTRLAGLLRQVVYVVDGLRRRVENLEADAKAASVERPTPTFKARVETIQVTRDE